jgi:hypothetical protein
MIRLDQHNNFRDTYTPDEDMRIDIRRGPIPKEPGHMTMCGLVHLLAEFYQREIVSINGGSVFLRQCWHVLSGKKWSGRGTLELGSWCRDLGEYERQTDGN